VEEAKQYTSNEREELVSKWLSSGMSKAAFCREHRIDLSRFYNWSCPSSNKRKKEKAVGFNPVRSSTTSVTSSLMVVQFPNGVQVKLPLSSEIDQVLILLGGLACS
jgi:hypothetical protein